MCLPESKGIGCDYCSDGLQADGETPCPCTYNNNDSTITQISELLILVEELNVITASSIKAADDLLAELAKIKEDIQIVCYTLKTDEISDKEKVSITLDTLKKYTL